MDQYEIVHAGVREAVPHVKEGNAASGEIDTVAALKRRRLLIAVLVVAATVAALLVTRMMTPLYEAEAGIMFNPRELTLMGATTQSGTMLPSEETARKNYIAIVRSRGLAEAVVDRLQLEKLPEFNPTLRPPSRTQALADQTRATLADWMAPLLAMLPESMQKNDTSWRDESLSQDRIRDEVINRFMRRLETSSSDASRVIGIRFLSEDKERAALIANTIAEQFIIRKRDQELAGAEVLANNLSQEVATLNKEIQDAERRVDERRLALGIHSDSSMKSLNERMTELSRQLTTATAERVRAEAQFAEAQSARSSGDAASAQVLGSPLIQRLQEAATMASSRIAQLQLRYNEQHPLMIGARSELRDIRSKIGEEMAKIQNSRHNAVAIAKANEAGLRQQMDQLKGQMARSSESEVDIAVLEREVEAKRTLMPTLTARLNNANAQIDYLRHHGAETQVISQAVVPRFASHPPILAIMATAVVLAAGGGGVLAVLLERADNTIQSTSQLRRITPLRVLGTLPVARGGRRRSHAPAQLVVDGKDSVYLEHLRTIALRAGAAGPVPVKVLLVTSSVSSEGKSSAASSLGRMLALSGRRTIIIDADLRAPTMHRVFGLRRRRGLSEFIQEGLPLEDVVQTDPASGADIITAGHCRGASADVLQSSRMQELIGHLAITYDTVIIDSPPVLAVCDAHILARLADRTLMVVRWKSTLVSTLVSALQRLSDDHVPVDGIILSQVDGKKYGVYGYSDSEIFSPGFRKYYTH